MSEPGDLPRPSGLRNRTPSTSASPPPVGPEDEVSARLKRFAASTNVAVGADLAARVHARLATEPAPSPARRFLVAVCALAPRPALAALRQSIGVALGRGRFSMVVRAQALGLVLLVALSVAALGAGGAVLVSVVVQHPDQPSPSIRLPKASPSPTDALRLPGRAPEVSKPTASAPAVHPGPSQLPTPRPHPTPPASHPPDGPRPTPPASHPPDGPHPTPPASHPPDGPHPTPRPPHGHAPGEPHPTPAASHLPDGSQRTARPHQAPSRPHATPPGSHPSRGQQPMPPGQPPSVRAPRRRCALRRTGR